VNAGMNSVSWLTHTGPGEGVVMDPAPSCAPSALAPARLPGAVDNDGTCAQASSSRQEAARTSGETWRTGGAPAHDTVRWTPPTRA
jgi:hypothetical protein